MTDKPIGVFDSGVGGLTVAREIASLLPGEDLIYLGDGARLPYGPKPFDQVREYAFEILDYLNGRGVKLIVIACNTATAAALDEAQASFDIPILGVVEPGARGAVRVTRNRVIGVIGTVGTIDSGVYSRAVRAVDAGITVFSAACPKFVEIVETGLISDSNFLRPKTYNLAKGYLTPLLRAGIDTVVLGCTHYPLLGDLLGQVCGTEVKLISSARETALEVQAVLAGKNMARTRPGVGRRAFLTTGDPRRFSSLGARFFGGELTNLERVSLSVEGAAS